MGDRRSLIRKITFALVLYLLSLIAVEIILFNTYMVLECIGLVVVVTLSIVLVDRLLNKDIFILGSISVALILLFIAIELIYNHSVWILGCVIYFIVLVFIKELFL